jgi:hypothetical protein
MTKKTKLTKIEKKYKDKKTGEWKSLTIEHAKVKDRLKDFWEANPHGSITPSTFILEDLMVFKAHIIADKSDPSSRDATGHRYVKLADLKQGDYEKEETLAVGRALAFIGYATDGEIASFEEMENFLEHKDNKLKERILEIEELFNSAKTQDELKEVWVKLDGEVRAIKQVEVLKDKRKQEIINENSNVSNKGGVVASKKR